jgi:glyoxylase-like metal-dependent hydrolase (beta-lactamase superfamily II)
VGSAEQIAPGLRRWTSWHEEWKQEVASLAVQTADGLVLIDPIEPPPELRKPDHVLITVFWHGRSTGELGAKHVWAHTRGVRRLKNRGADVTDAFEPGDELPGGIQAFETARESEVVYWLPEQRSVAVGDVLLGAGAKPKATSEPLRLCPERWLGDANYKKLRKSLQPLLELPLQRILLSHGDPVLTGGKDALAAVLAG